MVLADTSIWVDHFRKSDPLLVKLLLADQVLGHAFVIGELALGNFANRADVFGLMQSLPAAALAEPGEMLTFIDQRRLTNKGIGYVDACLLSSTALQGNAQLWTRDKRLLAAAQSMKLAFSPAAA